MPKRIPKARLDEALEPPTRQHPVVSALQFGAQLHGSEKGDGGATMDVNTSQMHPKATNVWMVGGEPDTAGKRIPTTHAAAPPGGGDLTRTLRERERVRSATGGRPRVGLGGWINPDTGGTEYDAALITKGRTEAKTKGKRRGEWGVFNNKRGKTLRTTHDGVQ